MTLGRQTARLVGGLGFGESPRWHDGRLWLSDMEDRTVLTVAPDGAVETMAEVPGTPSGIGWLPDGTLLVVSMAQRCVLSLDAGGLGVYADLSDLVPGDANEMVVDRSGRAYVGNVGFDHRAVPFAPRPTHLVVVTEDQELRPAGEDLLVPNGTVVTQDGCTLIVAETLANRLTAFDIGDGGALSGRRTFAEMPGRLPDGICLDAEGCVWVADSSASMSFVRVREGGAVVDEIDAGRPCYACMLGGTDGTTLFMVTADGHDDDAKARHSGAVDTIEVEVPAAGWP